MQTKGVVAFNAPKTKQKNSAENTGLQQQITAKIVAAKNRRLLPEGGIVFIGNRFVRAGFYCISGELLSAKS